MAAGDLTDLATANIAAKIDSPTAATNAILGSLITAVSGHILSVLNRNVLSASYSELYKGNDKNQILLRQRPVTAIASVSFPGNTITIQGDPFAGTAGVWTDGRSCFLINDCFPNGTPVRINYTAGYATVPLDISLATAELVAEAYARRAHVGETSRSQGGQTTISFDTKEMAATIMGRLRNYVAVAPV